MVVLLGLLASLALGTVAIGFGAHDIEEILGQGAFFVALLSTGLLAGPAHELHAQLALIDGVQEKKHHAIDDVGNDDVQCRERDADERPP